MNASLTPYQRLTPSLWRMIQELAPVLKESRLFGISTDSQAVAIMTKGAELGLSLTTSFEYITVIEGRPALIPRGALALILNSPQLENIRIDDMADEHDVPTGCRVWMKRTNGFEYTSYFTMEDAKRAELVKPGSGWAKYPAQMLKWRAVGFCADVVFPDLLGGLKRADELGSDLTPEGDVVDGHYVTTPVDEKPVSNTEVGESPFQRLQALLGKFSAEAIANANGGIIPTTHQELDAVLAALQDVDFYQKEG